MPLLTKFDVAERQLIQALKLFFGGGDDVSIHTLSEAAAQVLHDIAGSSKTISILRGGGGIRPENRKEWFSAISRARNFFKHADKDQAGVLDFNPMMNTFSLLDAVNMYVAIKGGWTPESKVFFTWFGLKHPRFLIEGTDLKLALDELKEGADAPEPDDMDFFLRAINRIRETSSASPALLMHMGLRAGNV
jgi:hypothetical protein